ncbi:MAG: hypothetical protein IPP07_13040 [Holophagales bacterium]|nr:hypothetical protein [Holophagales bacterium]
MSRASHRPDGRKEIIELLQRLSTPYGTKIAFKEWYGEVELPATPAVPSGG